MASVRRRTLACVFAWCSCRSCVTQLSSATANGCHVQAYERAAALEQLTRPQQELKSEGIAVFDLEVTCTRVQRHDKALTLRQRVPQEEPRDAQNAADEDDVVTPDAFAELPKHECALPFWPGAACQRPCHVRVCSASQVYDGAPCVDRDIRGAYTSAHGLQVQKQDASANCVDGCYQ